MEEHGIVWCGRQKFIPKRLANEGAIADGSEYLREKVLTPLKSILDDRPVVPLMIFRYPPPDSPDNPTNLLHPDAIDNMFLSLLKTSLEVSIYEIAPILANNPKKFTVSVFVATRKRVNEKLTKENWERLYEKFGIQASAFGRRIARKNRTENVTLFDYEDVSLIDHQGKYNARLVKVDGDKVDPYYQTIRSDSIYTIISEVLSMRQSDIELTIDKSIGVRLKYGNSPNQYPHFRHIHYLADYVTHFANLDYKTGTISNAVFSAWQPAQKTGLCIIEYRDDAFLNVIDASRRLEAGDLVGALLQIALSGSKNESTISRIVKGRMNASLKKLEGIDFLRFSRMLRELASQFLKKLSPTPFSNTRPQTSKQVSKESSSRGEDFTQHSHNRFIKQNNVRSFTKKERSQPIDKCISRQEAITIKEIIHDKGLRKFVGERNNGQIVKIASNQTEKLGESALTIKVGDKVHVDIFGQGPTLFGRNITLTT